MRWKAAHLAHDVAETISSSLFTTKTWGQVSLQSCLEGDGKGRKEGGSEGTTEKPQQMQAVPFPSWVDRRNRVLSFSLPCNTGQQLLPKFGVPTITGNPGTCR